MSSSLKESKVESVVQIEPTLSFTQDDLEGEKRGNILTTITSPHTGKEVKITGEVDEAMKYAISNVQSHTHIDEKTSRRLLRKIDFYLLPVMCLLYCFQFMDKLSNSYASILGLRTDLNMDTNMYSNTGTLFYVGYLAWEFPASFMLQRLPVAKTVSVYIVLWGVVLCLHSLPQYGGFIALRTILGMLELSVTPAFTIITAQWYKREEQFLRTALWFACNGLGIIVGSSIAYGLYEHQDSYSIKAWKLVFVVTGCLTIFLGIVVFFHIPDKPTQAWFLTEEEKPLVVERIRSNQQGFGNKKFKVNQFYEAISDYKTWLIFLFALSNNIPNGGITNFGSILLNETFGYTTKKSLLMQMPQGAVELVGCCVLAYVNRFIPSRLLLAAFGTAIAVAGECMLAFCNQRKAQLAGYCIYTLAPIGFICLLSVIASNVAGHTKKVTTNALYLIAYCVGNLIGPKTFIESQSPDYNGAKVAIVICGIFSFVCLLVIWVSYYLENKRRDMKAGEYHERIENQEFADLTDKENPDFRYVL